MISLGPGPEALPSLVVHIGEQFGHGDQAPEVSQTKAFPSLLPTSVKKLPKDS